MVLVFDSTKFSIVTCPVFVFVFVLVCLDIAVIFTFEWCFFATHSSKANRKDIYNMTPKLAEEILGLSMRNNLLSVYSHSIQCKT